MAWGNRGIVPDKKKPRETLRHLEAPPWRKIICFISSPMQEFERAQIDLDASEAPSPFRGSWESHLRLLTFPVDGANLRPAVLRIACKPPALIHLRLQLVACEPKGG